MLGVFASNLLTAQFTDAKKVQRLVSFGLAAGWLWSFHFPIVKNRWTSSYVLWCGALSCLLIALFYWVIDMRGWRKWAGLLVAIGSNSILAYLTASLFMGAFSALATALLGGLKLWLGAYWHGVWMAVATCGLAWLFFIYLHSRQLYLRL